MFEDTVHLGYQETHELRMLLDRCSLRRKLSEATVDQEKSLLLIDVTEGDVRNTVNVIF